MITPEFINHSKTTERPELKIALRTDYYDLFRKVVKNFFDESGCNLFHHNVIKNYGKEGHVLSTYGSNEEWRNLYWNQYCQEDPLEETVHKNIHDSKLSISSMNILEPNNQCTEDRFKICNIKNGFLVSVSHGNEINETMLFGWQDFDPSTMSLEKIGKICASLEPIRNFHMERGLEVFS